MWDENFTKIIADFAKSSQDLADAAALCDGDPIKQDMVIFVQEEFQTLRSRSEGIKLLIEKNYLDNRDFIFEEMKSRLSK